MRAYFQQMSPVGKALSEQEKNKGKPMPWKSPRWIRRFQKPWSSE
jgi:hypothetical protein